MPAHLDILLALVVVRMKYDREIVEKKDISGLTKIKGGSTIRNALKKLKDLGFIEYVTKQMQCNHISNIGINGLSFIQYIIYCNMMQSIR